MATSKTIVMVIERSSDFYDAYSKNCNGIYAAGANIEEVRANTEDAIRLIKEELPKSQWPEELLGDYEIVFECDTKSFLEFYRDTLSLAGLQEITGINQKQLSSYLNGRTSPPRAQREKINSGIRKFANELLEMSVI